MLYKVFLLYVSESLGCDHQTSAIEQYFHLASITTCYFLYELRTFNLYRSWDSPCNIKKTIWKNSDMRKWYSSHIVFQTTIKRETRVIRIGQSISFQWFQVYFHCRVWTWLSCMLVVMTECLPFPPYSETEECEEGKLAWQIRASYLLHACTWKNVWERSD